MADPTGALVGNVKDLTVDTNTPTRKVTNNALDKDAFLNLLVTQLKNQDPMKPMEDSQFISQMAQFSSLEQMQNMNQTITAQAHFQNLSNASTMIGKYATLVDGEGGGGTVTGLVQEVRQQDDKLMVVIDGKPYNATEITSVASQAPSTTDGSASGSTPPASSGSASKYSTLSVTDAVANKYKLQSLTK
jgi:flagellar basal-body rod modification protein FlgD